MKLDQMFIDRTLKVKNTFSINKTIAPKMCRYNRMSHNLKRIARSRMQARSQSQGHWGNSGHKRYPLQKSLGRTKVDLIKEITTQAPKGASLSPYQDIMGVTSSSAKLYKRRVSAQHDSFKEENETLSTNTSSERLFSQRLINRNIGNLRAFSKTKRILSGTTSSSKRSIVINLTAKKFQSDAVIQTEECSTPSECSSYADEDFRDYGYKYSVGKDGLSPSMMLPKINIRGSRCSKISLF